MASSLQTALARCGFSEDAWKEVETASSICSYLERRNIHMVNDYLKVLDRVFVSLIHPRLNSYEMWLLRWYEHESTEARRLCHYLLYDGRICKHNLLKLAEADAVREGKWPLLE